MKSINDLNEFTLRAFIAGVQATYERGDIIDKHKCLDWVIVDTQVGYLVKAVWIKGITYGKGNDPQMYTDNITHFDYYYFGCVLNSESLDSFCERIITALDKVNENKFFED